MPEADDICRNVFLLQAHMFRRYDFGAEVDWTKVIDDDIESRVWMNAHPWMWQLLNAYQASGDEKYVVYLCRLFNSWYGWSMDGGCRSAVDGYSPAGIRNPLRRLYSRRSMRSWSAESS